jgi:aspartate aminotransferase-like enzyme
MEYIHFMDIPVDFTTKKIMTPGPVPLPLFVKKSLQDYECHHRMQAFGDILLQVFNNLKNVFQTEQHCYLLACTGTGGLEATLVNTIKRSDHLLYINGGKFGERWGKLAQAYGVNSQSIQVPWGQDIDLNLVESHLKSGHYQALAFQACETSTGALLPVADLCALAKKYGALSLVDGITALGAMDLPMDRWGVDVLVGGSQKSFMLPTGLAFVSLSARAEAIQSDLPRFYFDLASEKKQNLLGKTNWSTPTQPVLALHLVLEYLIQQQGLQNYWQLIAQRAQYFRDQVGLPLFPQTSSPSLSCLRVPPSVSAKAVVKKIYEDGYMIVAGQDQLEDSVLRVGHMGDMSMEDLKQVAQLIKKHVHG